MAAVTTQKLNKGDKLTLNDLRFCRTSQETDMSQIDNKPAVHCQQFSEIKNKHLVHFFLEFLIKKLKILIKMFKSLAFGSTFKHFDSNF